MKFSAKHVAIYFISHFILLNAYTIDIVKQKDLKTDIQGPESERKGFEDDPLANYDLVTTQRRLSKKDVERKQVNYLGLTYAFTLYQYKNIRPKQRRF